MNSYALTKAAAGDIREITRDTLKGWGIDQAKAYSAVLQKTFENLAAFPDIGRAVEERQGYFRLESGNHVVFYRKQAARVLIVRVLHQRMEPRRHLKNNKL